MSDKDTMPVSIHFILLRLPLTKADVSYSHYNVIFKAYFQKYRTLGMEGWLSG